MSEKNEALEAVKKRYKILPPVSEEEARAKAEEIKARQLNKVPYKEAPEDVQAAMDRFYEKGNRRD